MGDLKSYLGKKVILTDVDKKQWKGIVDLYDPSDENDSGEDSISLKCDGIPNQLIEFMKSEISEIKIA